MGRYVETQEYVGMVRRVIRALGRRAADDVDALAAFAELRAELAQAEADAARACHAAGFSWTEIANALGTSRQNARQRFGRTGQLPGQLELDPVLDAVAAGAEAQAACPHDWEDDYCPTCQTFAETRP